METGATSAALAGAGRANSAAAATKGTTVGRGKRAWEFMGSTLRARRGRVIRDRPRDDPVAPRSGDEHERAHSPRKDRFTSMRRARTSTERIASRTIGTSRSGAPSRATSSASHDGSGSIRRTTPTRRSPSITAQPASSCAQYSPSSSGGGAAAGAPSGGPRRGPAPPRPAWPARRRIGRSGVPAVRSTPPGRPSSSSSSRPASSRTSGRVTWKDPSSPCGRPTRPASMGGSVTGPALLDDVDEHAAVVLDRRRLDHGPQRLGGAPATADDLAVVVVADGQLEHERAVVLLELLDPDAVRLVHQRARQVLEELLHPGAAPSAGCPAS